MKSVFLHCVFFFVLLSVSPCWGQADEIPVKSFRDIEYLRHGEQSLKLDLYVPEQGDKKPFPLLVWIHGGGWIRGSKTNCRPFRVGFCQRGYAAASLSYRFTDVSPFPAQLEDVKAAIRWLRAHAEEYGIDPNRIGVMGSSAGGHLACMAGVTGNTKQFDVGENLDQSSAVQAVCNFYGPTEFSEWVKFFTSEHPSSEKFLGLIRGLIGGDPDTSMAALEKVSPISYVHADAVPFLHIHGTNDQTVPFEQAERLHDRLRQSGVSSRLFLLPRAGHGGKEFSTPEINQEILNFFDQKLTP